jgi:nucleoside-diphosphate-sugar epimerase
VAIKAKGEIEMRVFVTGATGFIGSAIVPELIQAGHQVLGLARSDAGAQSLIGAGAEVQRGDLEDLEGLRKAAAQADGVIHTAFNHDFSKFAANCEMDRRAIEALASGMAGSDRPLVVTSGTGMIAPGRVVTEDDVAPSGGTTYPRVSEQTATSLAARGIRASVVRLPQVHDRDKHGLVTYMIDRARESGISVYVDGQLNRWPAVHRLDAAHLYRLALEKGSAGARYHAVAEEGVSLQEIAEAIGRGLDVPVVAKSRDEASQHFGFLGFFVGIDSPASSALTQERLGWRPTAQPGMIEDLDNATAFQHAVSH